MSDNKDLPAYPIDTEKLKGGYVVPIQHLGLTKRELLAAMCLQGLLANPTVGAMGYPYEAMAQRATDQADALLTHLSNTHK